MSIDFKPLPSMADLWRNLPYQTRLRLMGRMARITMRR